MFHLKNHFINQREKSEIIQFIFDNCSKMNEGSLTLVFQDACLIQINKKEVTQVNEDEFTVEKERGLI